MMHRHNGLSQQRRSGGATGIRYPYVNVWEGNMDHHEDVSALLEIRSASMAGCDLPVFCPLSWASDPTVHKRTSLTNPLWECLEWHAGSNFHCLSLSQRILHALEILWSHPEDGSLACHVLPWLALMRCSYTSYLGLLEVFHNIHKVPESWESDWLMQACPRKQDQRSFMHVVLHSEHVRPDFCRVVIELFQGRALQPHV